MGSEALRFNEKTMRVLQRSAVFSGFALENIDKVIIEAEAYELTFQEGEFIRRQGEKLDFYPIVITGIVQAEMPRDSGPMIVERFMPGESFAEAIPKGMGICPVNIVASQDVRLVAIPAANVRSEESPLFERLSKNITGEMSKKVGRLTAKLSMLSETRIRPRLMKYVKTLPSRKDGSCILPETRRDMAAEMGVHEKALLRELRLLQEEGIIALDGRRLEVLRDDEICW